MLEREVGAAIRIQNLITERQTCSHYCKAQNPSVKQVASNVVSSDFGSNYCLFVYFFTLMSSGYPLVTPLTWEVSILCVRSFMLSKTNTEKYVYFLSTKRWVNLVRRRSPRIACGPEVGSLKPFPETLACIRRFHVKKENCKRNDQYCTF